MLTGNKTTTARRIRGDTIQELRELLQGNAGGYLGAFGRSDLEASLDRGPAFRCQDLQRAKISTVTWSVCTMGNLYPVVPTFPVLFPTVLRVSSSSISFSAARTSSTGHSY